MCILFFDTETTGFTPGNICQLSYIILEGDKVSSNNLYFKVKYVEAGAERIHGLSASKLTSLSNNLEFKDRFEEVKSDFSNAKLLVAHNFNFDLNFIRAEFDRCGYKFKYKNSLCTMQYFTNICKLPKSRGTGYKWPRLEELIYFLKIQDKEIKNKTKEIFNIVDIGYHDARFDTVATYLSYIKSLEKGLIKLS